MRLHSFKRIKGKKIDASGEEIGKIRDLYFDDERWTVRYLVVDTGGFLATHEVLISPAFIAPFDWDAENIPVRLTAEQIKNAPSVETAKPVSRQYEMKYYDYFAFPYYWEGPGPWGYTHYPSELEQMRPSRVEEDEAQIESGDPHLRSAAEIKGYSIDAEDDRFGKIQDLIFDESTWGVRYFVIDTVNFIPSKKVLVSPEWTSSIDWTTKSVRVPLPTERIRSAPEYDPSKSPDRAFEAEISRYYGKPLYWETLPERRKTPAA